MESDWRTLFSGFAIIIASISLFISIKNYKFSKQQHQEKQDFDFKKTLASEHKSYIDLYSQELQKIKKITDNLSHLLVSTNSNIGLSFEKYENNFLTEHFITRHLRHIYDETHELIKDSFKNQLSWQTPQYIYSRLTYFKNLRFDDDDSLNPDILYIKQIKKNVQLLSCSINQDDQSKLYNDFLSILKELAVFFEKINDEIIKSTEILENALIKNSFEEFKLENNYKLYRLYIQLINFLKFVSHCRIQQVIEYEKNPNFKINNIVFIGANICIINELLLRVSFNIWEE